MSAMKQSDPPPNESRLDSTLDNLCKRITQVMWPVTLCALYTCLLVRILSHSLTPNQPNILDSTWRRLGLNIGNVGFGGGTRPDIGWTSSLIIVLVFCLLIVFVTLLVLLVLYLGWHKCLVYYFYLPTLIILAVVTPAFLRSILAALNWFVPDMYTFIILNWNFTALGMMAIFGLFAPTALGVQQFYLIHNSAMLSVLALHALPGWAPWLLLAFLVLWDLFAVLSPIGPLNLIINMAESRGMTNIPGLVYSTDMSPSPRTENESDQHHSQTSSQQTKRYVQEGKKDEGKIAVLKEVKPSPESQIDSQASLSVPKTIESDIKSIPKLTSNPGGHNKTKDKIPHGAQSILTENASTTEQGVSIGLGDFIFYSLLIGLSSSGRKGADFNTVLATLVAILFGLALTLVFLAITKRALPALPISIGLGLAVTGLSCQFATNFSGGLATRAIFV